MTTTNLLTTNEFMRKAYSMAKANNATCTIYRDPHNHARCTMAIEPNGETSKRVEFNINIYKMYGLKVWAHVEPRGMIHEYHYIDEYMD